MIVNKLRVPTDDNGLVPAGEYFKRLAAALREANERQELLARSSVTRRRRTADAPQDHATA